MGDIDSSVKSNIPILRPTGRPFASKWTIQNDSGRYFEPAVRRYRRVKVDGPKKFKRESECSKIIKRWTKTDQNCSSER